MNSKIYEEVSKAFSTRKSKYEGCGFVSQHEDKKSGQLNRLQRGLTKPIVTFVILMQSLKDLYKRCTFRGKMLLWETISLN